MAEGVDVVIGGEQGDQAEDDTADGLGEPQAIEVEAPGAGFGYMLVASILAQLAGVFPVLARPLLASRLLAGLTAFRARHPAGGIGGAHAGEGGLARGQDCGGPGSGG
ncbi:MAG: hypothetical protein ACK6DG_13475, partial [Cyanobacteriota bacterium]